MDEKYLFCSCRTEKFGDLKFKGFDEADLSFANSGSLSLVTTVYTQVLSSCLTAFRSPLTPLEKGGIGIKVPLFKGDLGGSDHLCVHDSSLVRRGLG